MRVVIARHCGCCPLEDKDTGWCLVVVVVTTVCPLVDNDNGRVTGRRRAMVGNRPMNLCDPEQQSIILIL